VRFEPTPRGDARTETPEYALHPVVIPTPVGTPTPEPTTSATPAPSGSQPPTGKRPEDVDDPGAGGDGGGAFGVPIGGGAGRGLLLGAGLVLLLAVPSVVGYVARRRRRTHAVDQAAVTHAAWETLADAAEDSGYPLRSSDSPRTSARRLVAAAGLSGSVADEVTRLASAEERARYARSAPAVDGLDASARQVRKALLATLSRWRRVRAVVLPASSTRRMREAFDGVSRGMDRSRTAVRARLAALVRRRPAAGRAG